MALKLRQLSPEEQATIEKWAHSRTASARLVERARIILLASQGHRVPAIAQQSIGKSNGLFHRPRPPTPCHSAPASARA